MIKAEVGAHGSFGECSTMREQSRRFRTTTKGHQSNPVATKQLPRIQEPTPANRAAIEMLAQSKGLAPEGRSSADNTTPLRRTPTTKEQR